MGGAAAEDIRNALLLARDAAAVGGALRCRRRRHRRLIERWCFHDAAAMMLSPRPCPPSDLLGREWTGVVSSSPTLTLVGA